MYCGEVSVCLHQQFVARSPLLEPSSTPRQGPDRAANIRDFTKKTKKKPQLTLINDAEVRGAACRPGCYCQVQMLFMKVSSKAGLRVTAKRKFSLKTPLQTACDVHSCWPARSDWAAATFLRRRTYWRSLIPAGLALYSEVTLLLSTWKEVRRHPSIKGNPKDEATDELRRRRCSTKRRWSRKNWISRPKWSDYWRQQPPPSRLIVTPTKCEMVTSMHWVAHSRRIIGFPVAAVYAGFSVSLIGLSVKLRSPHNLNK